MRAGRCGGMGRCCSRHTRSARSSCNLDLTFGGPRPDDRCHALNSGLMRPLSRLPNSTKCLKNHGVMELNRQSTPAVLPRDELEESRRRQLMEVTIDSLAEVGYVGSTLAQIASRANVSPGLVAHYFRDKDGLLAASFRTLARRLAQRVQARLQLAYTPAGRIQAVIDANLAPEEFDRRTGSAWLAFWGQVLHADSLKRVQKAYQSRTLSNLCHALKQLLPAREARSLAAMIAAMIDGVWLRAALSNWREADSESARTLLTAFVDGRLRESMPTAASSAPGAPVSARASACATSITSITSINPATGAVLAEIRVDGPGEIDA